MPPSQKVPPPSQNTSISPRSSGAPLLPASEESQQFDGGAVGGSTDSKSEKKGLFGLAKKKADQEPIMESSGGAGSLMPGKQSEPKAHPQSLPLSPARNPYPAGIAASPGRLRSSSPRLHSPASSEIFERNVQEPVPMSTLQSEDTSAHIPSHVMSEDHIPPALEATANAITSNSLNADEVEIVTSSSHQPAAEKVLEASASHADLTQLHSPSLKHAASTSSDVGASLRQLPTQHGDDGASSYGQLDPNDVRRLSFISFADVVQSEHQQQAASAQGDAGSRDNLHTPSLPGSFPSIQERASSPFRSPRSPPSSIGGGVTTPPGVSVDPAYDQSPSRSTAGLTDSTGHHGDLTIQTMRQAVRKTASGDLSGARNPLAMSPVSDEASSMETRSRTNT
ncbi:hypothetical protein LTR15_003186 [Elasticomyces elasticus]|nr:hypothetical protein LTR15_003186 [Elasticomyces elasticus]